MHHCHICNTALSGDNITLKEQHFGSNEEFLYRQCPNCMCIQILDIPSDMAKYYPQNYYSRHVKKHYRNNIFLSRFRSFRLNSALHNNPLSHILTRPKLPGWMAFINLHSSSRILDVGCGSGQRLLNMRKKGFYHLEGVEPFIERDIHYPNGVVVHKNEVTGLAASDSRQGYYDLIMLHHSLEHIPDQHQTLKAAYQLLSGNGTLLIRIPICSSHAWEHYRENWVQLDAPRHLYTHSRRSIELLAAEHGFLGYQTCFDSCEFQFTGSERYLKGIPLMDGPDEKYFSAAELSGFREMAEKLNREERGDQAVFIFTRKQHNREPVLQEHPHPP